MNNSGRISYQCKAWHEFTKHQLTKNMRVERIISKEPHCANALRNHAKWLFDLGNGKLSTIFDDIIEVPKEMVCDGPDKLECKIYNNFEAMF